MDMLLMTGRAPFWEGLRPMVEQYGVQMRMVTSLDEGLAAVHEQAPALVLLDLGMDAEALRPAVIEILKIDAMIHTAAVSEMSAADFHEQMEGLGMLMSLPGTPSAEDLTRLMVAFHDTLHCI
ncbi:MAG: hypothetical protein IJD16_09680 [Desulfovibrio sp.]|nr:hypothetical protein [Desulfovibrio sp.]